MRYRRKIIGIVLRGKSFLLPWSGKECNEKEEIAIPEMHDDRTEALSWVRCHQGFPPNRIEKDEGLPHQSVAAHRRADILSRSSPGDRVKGKPVGRKGQKYLAIL